MRGLWSVAGWVRGRVGLAHGLLVLGLVLVLSGGAFAASRYLITSKKQISPKVLRQLHGARGERGPAGPAGAKGDTGATGAAGAVGPAGKDGTNGTDGSNGTNGTDGKSVVLGSAAKCVEGGVSVEVEGSKAPREVCNGAKGVLHPGETLPSGASETGAWAMFASAPGFMEVTISFPIPLAAALEESHVEALEVGQTSAHCPGSVEAPSAEPGYLCVYQTENAEMVGVVPAIIKPGTTFVEQGEGKGKGAGVAGAKLFNGGKAAAARDNGSWAVTAP